MHWRADELHDDIAGLIGEYLTPFDKMLSAYVEGYPIPVQKRSIKYLYVLLEYCTSIGDVLMLNWALEAIMEFVPAKMCSEYRKMARRTGQNEAALWWETVRAHYSGGYNLKEEVWCAFLRGEPRTNAGLSWLLNESK